MSGKRAREEDYISAKPTKIRRDDFDDQLAELVAKLPQSVPDPRTQGGPGNVNFLTRRQDAENAISNNPKLKEKGI